MEGEAKRHCFDVVCQGSDIYPEVSIPKGFRLGIVIHLEVLNVVETLKIIFFNYNLDLFCHQSLKRSLLGFVSSNRLYSNLFSLTC